MRGLTAEQRARFAQDGFLVLDGFVDRAACDPLRARADELVAGFDADSHRSIFTTDDQARRTDDYFLDSAEEIHFFFEEEAFDAAGALRGPVARSINKLGHALHDLDPVFAAFSRTPALAALVASLGVDEPRLVQSMYIFKQPFIGGEVRCHQDATFLHTEPDRLLGLWFALEDAREDNGCLWALPGGHRGGLRARFVRTGRATRMDVLDPTPWDEAALVPLEVGQGGLVLLDGHLPHASRANRSPASRHAYTLHVIDGAGAYPPTNWLQRRTPPRGFAP
ncbi:MAG TPA: phytanoyl-CoA dioxygenase family protein [Kofleriaceae bacterium]|nr:phytanoyl-CoA dioxygenase family protein [Kofleriaceae bacterium]